MGRKTSDNRPSSNRSAYIHTLLRIYRPASTALYPSANNQEAFMRIRVVQGDNPADWRIVVTTRFKPVRTAQRHGPSVKYWTHDWRAVGLASVSFKDGRVINPRWVTVPELNRTREAQNSLGRTRYGDPSQQWPFI